MPSLSPGVAEGLASPGLDLERPTQKSLPLAEHRTASPHITVEAVVADKSVRAGIDPYNKLVDRTSGDNVASVKESDAALAAAARVGG